MRGISLPGERLLSFSRQSLLATWIMLFRHGKAPGGGGAGLREIFVI